MGIKLGKILDPIPKINPLVSAYKASQHGGKPLRAFLDPMQHVLKSGPRTAAEGKVATDEKRRIKEKARQEKLYAGTGMTPPGMKKGGGTSGICRGGGAATRGMKFGKDG